MRSVVKTRSAALIWRKIGRLYPKAYKRYTGYIVVPTNNPEELYEMGLTPNPFYGRFFTPLHAYVAVTGYKSVRALYEEGIIERDAFPALERNTDGVLNLSITELVNRLDGEELKRLTECLRSDLAAKRKYLLIQDEDGWYRVYYGGIVGYYTDHLTLWEGLLLGKVFGKEYRYLLAVPVRGVRKLNEPYPLLEGQVHVGRVDYYKKAFVFVKE